MITNIAGRFNWKSIGFVILFSVLGLLALATTAEATNYAPTVQSAQLKDDHHYYTLTGTLNDPAGRALHDLTILTSVAGSGKWNETTLVPKKDAKGNLVWHFQVALAEKRAIDRNGLLFEFKRIAGEQTEWIKNKGGYFTIGGKYGNILLGGANVAIKQPVTDLVNGLSGVVYVKNIGFRPNVQVIIETVDHGNVTVKAVRKGFAFGSKNRVLEFEFTALVPDGVEVVRVTAVAKVNNKEYTDRVEFGN